MSQLIHKLLATQKAEFDIFYHKLNCEEIDNLIQLIINHKSNIYFCGVGKSENIASHTADMLKSIGIKAFRISPINSLHGDMGVVDEGDMIFLYSKSGNTKELIETAPYFQKKKCFIIGVFCNPEAKLKKYCNVQITLPCGKELDNGFDLVPTTSIVSFTVFCNLLVGGIIHYNKIHLNEYGKNHPAGSIGKKIWATIEDIMIPLEEVCCVSANKKLRNVLVEMSCKRASCCLLVKEEKEGFLLEGIMNDADIRNYIPEHSNLEIEVNKIATHQPYTVQADTKLHALLDELKQNNFHYTSGIPVMKNQYVIGLINSRQLLKY